MSFHFRGKRARALPGLTLAGLLTVAAGCSTDKLVAVDNPNQLQPGAVLSAGATPSLVQGAVFQFRGGYSGYGDDAFLTMSAAITDEFYWGDTFTTRQAADQRNLQPTALGNISDPAFSRLQSARVQARRAFSQVLKYSTPSTATADSSTAALMRSVEGYVYVTLSEGWCNDVPFSVLPDTGAIDPNALVFGAGVGTLAMNDSAIVRFNNALAYSPSSNLAKVGKARALLNQGKFAAAAAAVAAVPRTFVYRLEHSTNSSTENNPIAALQQNGRYGVSNLEGGTATSSAGVVSALRPDLATPDTSNAAAAGLPFRGIKDPRIPWEPRGTSGVCFTSSVRCYYNDNYPTFAASVPLASGVEARLIVAEALYQQGQYSAMLDTLNVLRANVGMLTAGLYPQQKQVFTPATLAALPASVIADPVTARQTLFAERAYWLFNTGHRQGDLRRLSRPTAEGGYGLATTAVFPSGPYFRGGTYGNDVAYPVRQEEANNPSYDPAACVTTRP